MTATLVVNNTGPAATAATNPARRPGNSASPVVASRTDPAAAAIGASNRTPSSVSPSTAVPIQIHSATMGGWSR